MKDKYQYDAYVERHLEPARREVGVFGYSRSEGRRLEGIDYDESGEAVFRIDDNAVRYTYGPVAAIPRDFALKMSLQGEAYDPHEWRDLTDLEIEDMATGDRRSINDMRPPGCRITFRVLRRSDEADSYYPGDDAVVMTSGLQTPASVVALCHEVGHARDRRRYPELYDESDYAALINSTLSANRGHFQTLRAERGAWAHALNFLRPFLSSDEGATFNIDKVARHVHERCLESYSAKIRREQAHPMKTAALGLGVFVARQAIKLKRPK